MRDPHLTEDGVPREITRIVFEPMEDGRFRWTLWSEDVMNHREVGHRETLEGILGITAMFCGAFDLSEQGEPDDPWWAA